MTPYNPLNHNYAGDPHPQYNNVMIYDSAYISEADKNYSKLVDVNLIYDAKNLSTGSRNGVKRLFLVIDLFDQGTQSSQTFGRLTLDFNHIGYKAMVNNSYSISSGIYNTSDGSQPSAKLPFHPDSVVYVSDTGQVDASGYSIYNIQVFVSGNQYGRLRAIPKTYYVDKPNNFNKQNMFDFKLTMNNSNLRDCYNFLFSDFVSNKLYSSTDLNSISKNAVTYNQQSSDFHKKQYLYLANGLSSSTPPTLTTKNGWATLSMISVTSPNDQQVLVTIPQGFSPTENIMQIANVYLNLKDGTTINLPGSIYIQETGIIRVNLPAYDYSKVATSSLTAYAVYPYY